MSLRFPFRHGPLERRRGPRFRPTPRVSCHVVTEGSERQLEAAIWNVSARGLALLLQQRLEPGTPLALYLGCDEALPFATATVVRHSQICFPNDAWLVGVALDQPLTSEELEQFADALVGARCF